MRRHALGLTLVELITVVAIIAILIGLLVPAVNVARRFAKETQQRVQLTAVDVGLMAFHNDFGDYPPSNTSNATGGTGTGMLWHTSASYCGGQKLAEALVGRDMRGFSPDAYAALSTSDGKNLTYYPYPLDLSNPVHVANLNHRKPLYLDLGTANAFRLGDVSVEKPGLYPLNSILSLAPDTFVLCDVYVRRTVVINNGGVAKEVKLGSPILYYRANTSGSTSGEIYQYGDNVALISAKEGNDKLSGPLQPTPNNLYATAERTFYSFINDPRVSSTDPLLGRPYRPDSYILVSAGADGMYGTRDDVCNFSR
jgi:type II secretory pathway pseudopilin PulG